MMSGTQEVGTAVKQSRGCCGDDCCGGSASVEAPTAKGQRFLNDLLEGFLAPRAAGPRERVISIYSTGIARP